LTKNKEIDINITKDNCESYEASIGYSFTEFNGDTLIEHGSTGNKQVEAQWTNKWFIDLKVSDSQSDNDGHVTQTYGLAPVQKGSGDFLEPTNSNYHVAGYYTQVDGGGQHVLDINGNAYEQNVLDWIDNNTWINTSGDPLYAYWGYEVSFDTHANDPGGHITKT
jgi:hypothetical protein